MLICAGSWKKIPLSRKDSERCPCGLFIRHIRIHHSQVSGICGQRLLFMSDFHIRRGKIFCPEIRHHGTWTGTGLVSTALRGAIEYTRPTHFIFGGDLIGSAVWIPDSLKMLADAIPDSIRKIAVPGNWEVRREKWLGSGFWKKAFEETGFHYLRNEPLDMPPFFFYGFDDSKSGKPCWINPGGKLPDSAERFCCILAHNPDTIPDFLPESILSRTDLILCGHTHGGQVRLPLYGALKTSSKYGKKFERGEFQHSFSGTRMIISQGVGTTWFPVRIFCPPEAVLIEFVS